MRRVLFLLLIPFVLSFSTQVRAAGLSDYQTKKEQIQQQIHSVQEKYKAAVGNKKIQFGMEATKLEAYEAAYQKAIDLIEQPTKNNSERGQSVLYRMDLTSFMPITMRPGEKVPTEYIPYYKAAGERYDVDWTVLAAIHKIETNFSRIQLMISPVGAIGHMQFMPSTFAAYGVDGNGDGIISPWNVQDSIFTAARYLSVNGYKNNVRGAIWRYNHADWYVNEVLQTASAIKGAEHEY